MGIALREAGLLPPRPKIPELPPDVSRGDLLPRDREPDFEPEIAPGLREQLRSAVRRAAAKAASLGALKNQMAEASKGQPVEPQRGEALIHAVTLGYSPPWQLALQRWLDAIAPGPRSVLPKALGAIAGFCDAANVAQVHVIQCDIEVTHDDWLEPPQLLEYRVAGFGGSDMTPGIVYYANDPEVQSVLVLTDGYITIPAQEPPYRILWCLIGDSDEGFQPAYGEVVKLNLD